MVYLLRNVSRLKNTIMANELALRIRQLSTNKIDFVHEELEVVIDGITTAALELDDAADAFSALSAGDVDQDDIANALVDLADIFDDANLSPDQSAKLDTVVDRLLKSGTDEQKAAAKELFGKVLGYGIAAKSANSFVDTLLAPDQE